MKLLIDLATAMVPSPFARLPIYDTPFSQWPTDHHNPSDVCGRCNRLLAEHHWQLVDEKVTEQGGVINCAGADW